MMTPEQGRERWNELHTFAWNYPEVATAEDQQTAREWLAEFARKVRVVGCQCGSEWDAMVAAVPPPLGGAREFYWWTVAAHDRVRAKLGRRMAAPAWSMSYPLLLPQR